MTTITKEMLRAISPHANDTIIAGIAIYLSEYTDKYELTSVLRLANFLGQCAHESDGFKTLEEYASGAAYEGRKDLGNVNKGDGVRYKGRGMIQLTGRANYKQYGHNIGVDLENNPGAASTPQISVETALEYWKVKGLNTFADRDDINTITHRINGGTNGLASRIAYTTKAKSVLASIVIAATVGVTSVTPVEAKDYTLPEPDLIRVIRSAEPVAKLLDDAHIMIEFRKRLPSPITYSNGVLHNLNKGSAAYKALVAANPKIPIDSLLSHPVNTAPVPTSKPAPPVVVSPDTSEPVLAERGDLGEYVKAIQHLLNTKAHSGITEDSNFGPGTEKAITDFQTANNLPVNGKLDNATLDALEK